VKVTSRSFWSVPPLVIALEQDSCPVNSVDQDRVTDFQRSHLSGQCRQEPRRNQLWTRRLCLGLQRALPGQSHDASALIVLLQKADRTRERTRDVARNRQAVQPADASAPRSSAVPAPGRVPAGRALGSCADFFEAGRDDEQRHDEPDAAQADAACVVLLHNRLPLHRAVHPALCCTAADEALFY
jgi:hypothetical protein